MATEKVSLTLDGRALREARTRVGRRGLSSYVDAALRIKLQHDRVAQLLDELETEHGPIPERVQRQARKEWLAAEESPKRKRPRR